MTACQLRTVAVIAKQPLAGRVKTRLIGPGVTARDAMLLAECSLRDTFVALAEMTVAHRVLILEGAAGQWLPSDWSVQPQSGGLLDERLSSGFDRIPDGPAVLVGMDTPQLSAAELAFDADSYDACLGIAADGGYWSIGFREPRRAREVISGVPMSRADTGAVQLQRMAAAGMRVQLLPVLTDVDTPASARLVAELSPYTAFARCWRGLRAAPVAVARLER